MRHPASRSARLAVLALGALAVAACSDVTSPNGRWTEPHTGFDQAPLPPELVIAAPEGLDRVTIAPGEVQFLQFAVRFGSTLHAPTRLSVMEAKDSLSPGSFSARTTGFNIEPVRLPDDTRFSAPRGVKLQLEANKITEPRQRWIDVVVGWDSAGRETYLRRAVPVQFVPATELPATRLLPTTLAAERRIEIEVGQAYYFGVHLPAWGDPTADTLVKAHSDVFEAVVEPLAGWPDGIKPRTDTLPGETQVVGGRFFDYPAREFAVIGRREGEFRIQVRPKPMAVRYQPALADVAPVIIHVTVLPPRLEAAPYPADIPLAAQIPAVLRMRFGVTDATGDPWRPIESVGRPSAPVIKPVEWPAGGRFEIGVVDPRNGEVAKELAELMLRDPSSRYLRLVANRPGAYRFQITSTVAVEGRAPFPYIDTVTFQVGDEVSWRTAINQPGLPSTGAEIMVGMPFRFRVQAMGSGPMTQINWRQRPRLLRTSAAQGKPYPKSLTVSHGSSLFADVGPFAQLIEGKTADAGAAWLVFGAQPSSLRPEQIDSVLVEFKPLLRLVPEIAGVTPSTGVQVDWGVPSIVELAARNANPATSTVVVAMNPRAVSGPFWDRSPRVPAETRQLDARSVGRWAILPNARMPEKSELVLSASYEGATTIIGKATHGEVLLPIKDRGLTTQGPRGPQWPARYAGWAGVGAQLELVRTGIDTLWFEMPAFTRDAAPSRLDARVTAGQPDFVQVSGIESWGGYGIIVRSLAEGEGEICARFTFPDFPTMGLDLPCRAIRVVKDGPITTSGKRAARAPTGPQLLPEAEWRATTSPALP